MRMILGAAALVSLAACDASPPSSSTEAQTSAPAKHAALPTKRTAFRPEWVPAAKGSGNFEVCLTDEASENEVKDVTLPVGTLLQSSVPLNGAMRNPEVELSQAKLSSEIWAEGRGSAVVLMKAIRLKATQPCAITMARVVLSDGWRYRHATVQVSDHEIYSFDGLHLDVTGVITNNMKGQLGEVGDMGVIVGTPVADIANAYTAPEDH